MSPCITACVLLGLPTNIWCRFVFQNAGSSIEEALAIKPSKANLLDTTYQPEEIYALQHLPYAELQRAVPQNVWQSYAKVCVFVVGRGLRFLGLFFVKHLQIPCIFLTYTIVFPFLWSLAKHIQSA